MSPAEWIVPGYENYLQRPNWKQTATTAEGNRVYSQVENRYCAKDARGVQLDSTCSDKQQVTTEFVFDAHGVPLSRTVRLGDQLVEQHKVIELTLN